MNSKFKSTEKFVNDSYRDYSDLYYAAVNLEETGEVTTTSSRAAAIISTGSNINEAEENCERGISYVSGNNIFVRHDIAKPYLIQKRIDNMEKLR